jgi:hypothetical protein
MSEDIDYDAEPYAVWRDGWQRARKEHRCHACRGTIRVRDEYHVTVTIFEGKTDTTKRCARCQAIYSHLQAKMCDEEYCNQTLSCGHEYKERWGEDPPPEIAALAFWLPSDGPPKVGEVKR